VAVPCLWLAVRVIRWRTTSLTLTSARLIERWGPVSRRQADTPLNRITSVAVVQSLPAHRRHRSPRARDRRRGRAEVDRRRTEAVGRPAGHPSPAAAGSGVRRGLRLSGASGRRAATVPSLARPSMPATEGRRIEGLGRARTPRILRTRPRSAAPRTRVGQQGVDQRIELRRGDLEVPARLRWLSVISVPAVTRSSAARASAHRRTRWHRRRHGGHAGAAEGPEADQVLLTGRSEWPDQGCSRLAFGHPRRVRRGGQRPRPPESATTISTSSGPGPRGPTGPRNR